MGDREVELRSKLLDIQQSLTDLILEGEMREGRPQKKEESPLNV